MMIGISMWHLRDVNTSVVFHVDIPFQTLLGRESIELVYVINLSPRVRLMVGSRDMPPCPITDATITGMSGHYRAIGRGVLPHDDHRAPVF